MKTRILKVVEKVFVEKKATKKKVKAKKEPRELLRKVELPFGVDGAWRVERVVVSKEAAMLERLQAFKTGRAVPEGEYTSLFRGGTLVMSDTPNELYDHYSIVGAAKGHVLIAGLGLGCVLQAVLDKDGVERATIIEKSPEVIRLVGPTYKKRYGDRLEIIEANIFEWKPPKDTHYGAAWFDVWNYICSDNIKEMKKLQKRFDACSDWTGSWAYYECLRNREQTSSWR